MKRLASYALMLFIALTATKAYAQGPSSPKPKQFDAFPNVISCPESELAKLFNTTPGQDISLSFSNNFSFAGNITANVVKYANLQSAVMVSAYYHNTVFNVSRRINKDNTVTYTGHMFNKTYFDGYELKRDAAGNYQLVKFETDRVIQDCKQN